MAIRPAPVSATLPDVPAAIEDPAVLDYLRRLRERIGAELAQRPRLNQPVSSILLLSPSQKVYSLSVDDAGNLHATLVTT